jgi:hypothetical protein
LEAGLSTGTQLGGYSLTANSPTFCDKTAMTLSRKIVVIVLSVLCGIVTGCGSLPKFQVAIDSDPQGVRVVVNSDYVGKTPTTYTIAGKSDRSFNSSWVQGSMIEFVATPPAGETNLFVQRKFFRPSTFFQQGDHIPEKIFFDMHVKTEQISIGES